MNDKAKLLDEVERILTEKLAAREAAVTDREKKIDGICREAELVLCILSDTNPSVARLMQRRFVAAGAKFESLLS